MQFPQNPPQSGGDHARYPPQDPPSPGSKSSYDRGTFDQRSFEVEPPYLPDSHDRSLGAAEYRLFPRISTSQRPTYSKTNDSTLRHQKSGEPNSERSFEMQDFGHLEPAYHRQQVLYQDALPGEITPYLGLRARLTQVPINRWTVLLLLILARMLILLGSLNTDLSDAKSNVLSACDKVRKGWVYALRKLSLTDVSRLKT